jgi:hypothetical protein
MAQKDRGRLGDEIRFGLLGSGRYFGDDAGFWKRSLTVFLSSA